MATTVAIEKKNFSDRINRIEISATMAVANEASKLKAQGADVVDFGAGEPHFSTPRHIKQAAIAALQQDFTKYTLVSGIPELRQAIVKRHATDFGSDYRPEESIVTVGGKQALFNAVQVLVDHGDEVVIPVPYWVSFKDIIEYAGGRCVFVHSDESDNFRLTASMIEHAVTPNTRAIILNTPNNPSGAVMDPHDLKEIIMFAHQRGIYVIADECYVYLNFTGKNISAGKFIGAREHLLILGSLSKTYAMTGWRMGYALAPSPIITAMQKLQSQSTSGATSFVQKAAVAALEGSQECVAQMRAEYIKLRDITLQGLGAISGIECTRPAGAFYAYPNVSSFFGRKGISSATEVAKKLLYEAHVATVPGEAFGTSEHIRLSYAVAQNDLERGLERMNEFFAKL